MAIRDWFKKDSVVYAFFVAGVVDEVKDVIIQLLRRLSSNEVERANLVRDYRPLVLESIEEMEDSEARERLQQYHSNRLNRLPRTYGDRKPYGWRDENRFIEVLGVVYKALKQTSGGDDEKFRERYERFLEAIALYGPKEFDAWVIEGLTHDYWEKTFFYLVEMVRTAVRAVEPEARAVALATNRHYRRHRRGRFAQGASRVPRIGWLLDPVGYFILRRRP